MDRSLKKGIEIVFITNIINLLFSLVTNFILPKYLSIETYAGIKEFQLYMSYVGLLHFGYVDSVYLKWGGKELSPHSGEDLKSTLVTMRDFELFVSGIIAFIAIVSKAYLLLFFSLSILPVNMNSFYKYLYQATGNFSRYGKIMNISAVATFALNVIIVFVLKFDNCYAIVALYVVLYYLIWIVFETEFRKHFVVHQCSEFRFSLQELIFSIRNGFFLTVGNLASLFLSSMDRWFVKSLLDTASFAFYSFAVSVEGLLNVAITPITTTLYNYFCKEKDIGKQSAVASYVIVFATLLPMAVFPIKLILTCFLKNYMEASSVIVLLFAAQMFYIVINSIFVNLYKAQRKQKRYFQKLVCVLVMGFGLNIILYFLNRSKEAFAIATLLSSIMWFFLSMADFRYLKIPLSQISYLLAELAFFLGAGLFLPPLYGLFLYILSSALLGVALMKSTYVSIIEQLKKAIRSKTGKK